LARLARNRDDAQTADLLRQLRAIDQQLLNYGMTGSAVMKVASGEAELQALAARREKMERDLTHHSAAYRKEIQRSQRGPAEIIASLPPGTALVDAVEFVDITTLGKDGLARRAPDVAASRRLGAFVLRSAGKVQWVDLGSSAELALLVDRWRASYGAGKFPQPGQPDPGAELRKRIWAPLVPLLGGARTILVCPDGPLNGLPWAALPGSKGGTFLIQEYTFAVIPAPQLLPELVQAGPQPATEPSLFLVGGINFGEPSVRDPRAPAGKLPPIPIFGPLPGSEREVNDLRAQFQAAFPNAKALRLLSKQEATRQAFLVAAPSHRFIHLATHGFFASESEPSAIDLAKRADLTRGGAFNIRADLVGRHPGLLSGLVFAGINRADRPPEGSIVTALEAAELDLDKVELLVLSACETGRGRVAGGEGVLGLQRAFQLAGARSVVASLWQVPDSATQALMTRFYRNLWEKRMGKVESLREAQLWLLKEGWRDPELKLRGGLVRPDMRLKGGDPLSPYYWAAFVLSGDWR
jgi:CHAT domain-containing protein